MFRLHSQSVAQQLHRATSSTSAVRKSLQSPAVMRPTLKAVRSSPSPFPFAQRFFHSSKYLRFTKSTPTLSKQAAEAASKAAASDGSSFCVMAFLKKVGTLYATYLGANYISNALIHPTQKIDYGILNQFFPDGRAMDSPFWGTRLPHLILIPTTLTFYDIVVGHISTNYFGLVSFAKTPKVWLLHLYVYTFLAVGTFFAIDSFFNPYLENKRMDNFTSLLHPLTIGMSLQWHAQIMNDMFMVASAQSVWGQIFRTACASSLVFFPVKSLAFGDFMEGGLSPHEKLMNGIVDEEQEQRKEQE